MTARTVDYGTVARDPEWLAHRYDPGADALRFVRLSRDDRARMTFLTDEYLPDRPRIDLHRQPVVAALPPPAPVHLILHSAFCCSTLVARALDVPGVATTLKEPVLLNDLVGCRRQGMDPRHVRALLGDALALLARPFEPGERVVIKPSNVVNAFAPAILTMQAATRVMLLHAPLPIYLASVARKGLWGRLWVRDLFVGLLADDLLDMGIEPRDHLKLTDLQVAAVGWLAQQQLFARLHQQFGSARVRGIDSERLLARPSAAIGAIAKHFGLNVDIDRVVAGPAFTTDSKSGRAFTAVERQQDQRDGTRHHADEINKVARWAEAVAAAARIPMALPGDPLA